MRQSVGDCKCQVTKQLQQQAQAAGKTLQQQQQQEPRQKLHCTW